LTKKILLLASYADSLILFRGPLMEKLVESGLEVHAAAPNLFESSEAYKEVCKLGVVPHEYPLSRTGMNPFKDLMTLFRLYFLMRSIKPDIVLSYTIKPIVYGSFAAYMSGVNRIYALVTGLGYAFIDHSNEIKRRFVRYLLESFYCYSLLRVKVIFFQNSDDEFLFRERKLIESTARTCVVNGSGVDLSFFKESPPCISPIRFLLIARFLGDKGIREYFQAAKIIKSKYPDVIFSLVGWSDTNPNAIPQKELDDWVGQNVIDLIGKLEDVRDIISTCSVYVLPC